MLSRRQQQVNVERSSIMNENIKNQIKESNIFQWQVAEQVGVSEFTLSKWFRHEITGARLEKINKAIDELTKGGE